MTSDDHQDAHNARLIETFRRWNEEAAKHGVVDRTLWSLISQEEVKRMNRVWIVLALAAVTFAEGFLGAVVAGGLTDLSVSTLQAAAVGAGGAALSVIVNGLGRLHAYLAARNA